MAQHTVRQLDFETRQDRDTGARVNWLRPPGATRHRNCCYQKCFTLDGQRLLLGGSFGPGLPWRHHLLDLRTRTAQQLADGAGDA